MLFQFEFMGVHLGLRVSDLNIEDWIFWPEWGLDSMAMAPLDFALALEKRNAPLCQDRIFYAGLRSGAEAHREMPQG
jgi:hypothetical protein